MGRNNLLFIDGLNDELSAVEIEAAPVRDEDVVFGSVVVVIPSARSLCPISVAPLFNYTPDQSPPARPRSRETLQDAHFCAKGQRETRDERCNITRLAFARNHLANVFKSPMQGRGDKAVFAGAERRDDDASL